MDLVLKDDLFDHTTHQSRLSNTEMVKHNHGKFLFGPCQDHAINDLETVYLIISVKLSIITQMVLKDRIRRYLIYACFMLRNV